MKKQFSGLCAVALMLMLFAVSAEGARKSQSPQKDESLRRGETGATLDPAMFTDPMVRDAYRIAKDIPWVLDSIYCYCLCKESPAFWHKSLLSCYVDDHAAV